MRMPDRDQQTEKLNVEASTEDLDRLRWLLQNSQSADQRSAGSRPTRLHRAHHRLKALVYEPRSSAAILAFLSMAVIGLSAFLISWKNGHSTVPEPLPIPLPSPSSYP